MPWLIVIKKIFTFIPLKVWVSIVIILMAYFSIKHYGNTQYAHGVADTKAEYEKAHQKALGEDLEKVKKELREAIAHKEQMDLVASETATKVEKYAQQNRELQDRIKDLKSKDITCRNIDPAYVELFSDMFKETK